MSAPDREDVKAVARVFMGGGEPCEGSMSDAEAILTDPSLAPVLLRALVRHGVLTKETTGALVRRGTSTAWAERRRYATVWEPLP